MLFSQEFGRMLKKIFAIKGTKLFLPLIVASYIIEIFEEEFRWLLIFCANALHDMMQSTTLMLSFQGSLHLVQILTLYLIASLPVWLVWLNVRKKTISTVPMITYYLGTAFWIVTAFLIIVRFARF